MRIENVIVDARDPEALGRWWAEALGWVEIEPEDGAIVLVAEVRADGTHPFPELLFVPDGDPDHARERIHLDLNSHTAEEQQATVERLLAMGAVHADVGQADDAPFVVLADPEGNNLCVLDARPQYAQHGSLAGWTLAAHDANALKDVWLAATGWRLASEEPGYLILSPPDGGADLEIITRPTMPQDDRKNRIHVDVAPGPDEDQSAVVERLLALGATRADIGQSGDEPWVVLEDQEHNQLCVLTPRS